MRMTVIGCGHLGATHAASMAEIGHEVVGVDIDESKIAILRSGRSWFHEPELDEMLARHVASGRLRFTTDFAEAGEFGETHFLGVSTPGMADRDDYDLSQVFAAVRSLAPHLHRPCVIVGKSTVSVGTTAATQALVRELAPAGDDVEVAWNPEFLREGHAVRDTLRPDRIVAGVASARAEERIREVYGPITDAGVPLVVTDPATCELVKGAANAFLSMKISFINAMADVCEASGADVSELADAIGLDSRIGRAYLDAGIGYGGGCLPKDTRAFAARAHELGVDCAADLLRAVDRINAGRRDRVVEMAVKACGGDASGRRVGVWGAAFKVGTDDVRDSPALDVAARLHALGATVTVYDPMAVKNAHAVHPQLGYADEALTAAAGADILLTMTAWPEFRAIDPGAVSEVVNQRVLIDARNAVEVPRWHEADWTLHRLGRT
ncbi:UDPglucose 6-dehydrogenase [Streptosporangium subroseum]|uniref:UDP-glucose 6-dehydrogenase n=2 Tax=Streptosporangium subroseum TaxID=106412 RepID=A0A239AEP2_9ACTN|nr:UDPglucose 6-dehydrogenase [Streptosporangium subroseum]